MSPASPQVSPPKLRTARALAKLRFRGRPLGKTAPKRKRSPSIHWAFVQRVLPPLVFGSSLISEHEVSAPRPRPTERYRGSTEGNGPPPAPEPPLLFSSVFPGDEDPMSDVAAFAPCLPPPCGTAIASPGITDRLRNPAKKRCIRSRLLGRRLGAAPSGSGGSHPASTRKPDEPETSRLSLCSTENSTKLPGFLLTSGRGVCTLYK